MSGAGVESNKAEVLPILLATQASKVIVPMARYDVETASILVAKAKAGSHSAFAELVRRYRPRILALCLHLTGNESEAEDVTQDVFLRAFKSLGKFEGRSAFFTWVYRMAVNRSLNSRRDRKRRRETDMDDPRIDRAVAVDARDNPDRATELRQTYARLLNALDALPSAMRTSVVLVSLQGLSHQEAAVIQQCSPGTIAWRLHEARLRLRKAMKRHTVVPRRTSRLSADLTNLLYEWGLPVLSPG